MTDVQGRTRRVAVAGTPEQTRHHLTHVARVRPIHSVPAAILIS
jgi:hypothetical protein